MPFIKLEKLITPALKRAGVQKQTDTALALERADFVIGKYLGEDGKESLRAVSIRYRTMTVASLSSSAAASLGMIQEDVLEYVNRPFGRKLIDRIRIIS